MKSTRSLTCIVCPRGCQMTVTITDGRVESVEGNFCKRGITYANDECTNPRRTVTSTVRCENGAVVAVKTESTVPKALIFKVMEEINSVTAGNTVRIGDVIIENVANTGVNVVATANAD